MLGLSLEPSSYRLDLGQGQRGTWCALDTLFLPPLLVASTAVSAACAVTGAPVRLQLDAARELRHAEPDALHLTVPVLDALAPPRGHAVLHGTFRASSRFVVDRGAAARVADPEGRRWRVSALTVSVAGSFAGLTPRVGSAPPRVRSKMSTRSAENR